MLLRLFTFVIVACSTLLSATTGAQFVQRHSAALPNPQLIFRAQERPQWCWAACNQMLLNAVGISQSQTEQATKRVRMFGGSVDQGAGTDYSQAAPCLGGKYTKANGQRITVAPYTSYLRQRNQSDPTIIIESLRQGIPVVMATPQHGRVCVGVDYITSGGTTQIVTLYLLNPAHGLWPVPQMQSVSMQQLLNEGLFGFMTFKIH